MSDRPGRRDRARPIVPGSGPSRRSTSTPTRPARTASSSRPSSSDQAAAAGVRLLAITDHDNLAGYRELPRVGRRPPAARARARASRSTPSRDGAGLEIFEGELHILGYGVDPDDEAFEAALASQRAARRGRFERDPGAAPGRWDRPWTPRSTRSTSPRDDALGRPTVARALVAAGHATSVEDAFERLLESRPARRTCRARASGPSEAIEAIRAARRPRRRWPISARPPTHLPLIRDLQADGAARPRGLLPRRSTPAARQMRQRRRPASSASSRRAAATTTATTDRTPRRTPGS